MKKQLLALLAKKEERKKALGTQAATTESVAELRSINTELEELNAEIAELRSMVDALPDDEGEAGIAGGELGGGEHQQRSQVPNGGLNVFGTYGLGQGNENKRAAEDPHATAEYRQAFMQYVQTGKKSDNLEFRNDQTTGTGDIGAVIPTTILNKVVEKLKDYGRIWARVTKTSMRGGVEVPLSSAKPVATWVAAGTMSEKQKKAISGKIAFSYHKLQCRVAVELVADTVAMPVFEQTITDNIYEAMIVAIEEAVINGTGTGQPLGIAKDTNIPATQIISVTAEEFGTYQIWPTIFSKLPRSYRNGAVLILADADWNKYIVGMVDNQGQPISRVNYGLDGTQSERLLGKETIPVEDLLPSIDDAATGDVVGILVKLSDYLFNSNMQMYYKRYFNEETDEWVSKSTLIADGKLADRNGVVLIKKKASTPAAEE